MSLKIRDGPGYISNTSSGFGMTGTLLGLELRKRKTPQEKIAIIQQTMEPDMTMSHVTRSHGIQPSLLFKWKNNIWKDVSLLLLPERMQFLPQNGCRYKINKRVTALAG